MNHRLLKLGLSVLVCAVLFSRPAAAQQVSEALAAFTPELTGYLYYQHDISSGDGKSNSFDISRMYIGGRYKLADNFTLRFLSDMAHEDNGEFELFAKYAYLDWKLNAIPANLTMGLHTTQNWRTPEKEWGYRGIRKAPLESFGDFWGDVRSRYLAGLEARRAVLAAGDASQQAEAARLALQKSDFTRGSRGKMGSSADLGLSFSLKPDKNTYLDVMVLNGTGYKKVEDDRFKNLQVRAGRYLLGGKLHLSGYFELEPWSSVRADGSEARYNNLEWDLLAGWTEKDRYQIAADLSSKRFGCSLEDITATSFAVFGNLNLGRKDLKALWRYDFYSSGFDGSAGSTAAAPLKLDGRLLILGLDYIPNSRVHIIPNLQVLDYEDSSRPAQAMLYLHALVSL